MTSGGQWALDTFLLSGPNRLALLDREKVHPAGTWHWVALRYGVAVPTQVAEMMGRRAEALPVEGLAVHFHDTRGTALANVLAALQQGIAIVDSSAGGLGGCPYAPGASGNLATEDLPYMLHGMGIETGVDLPQVTAASRSLAQCLGHPLLDAPERVESNPQWR